MQPTRRPGLAAPRQALDPEFVGRRDILESLAEAIEQRPTLALIEGEAGIGKTRLARELIAREEAAGRSVLLATCPAVRQPFPFGPLVEGVRRLCDDVTDLGLSPLGGALRPLFPEWLDSLPPELGDDDPRQMRHRLLRAVSELVRKLGVDVLVLEDAHWADPETLEWLLSQADSLVMTVILTYRPTEVTDDSLLLRLGAHPTPGAQRLRWELQPLDLSETRQLVSSMLGTDEISDKLVAFLHDNTDGVPLAVQEIVRLLRDRRAIVRRDGRWIRRVLDEIDVPPTVRASVVERIARLPAYARQLLESAAVLAYPANGAVLAEVAEIPAAEVGGAIDAALASGILREDPPGWYAFRHILDAQATVSRLTTSTLRYRHGRALAALRSQVPEPLGRLTRHAREAGEIDLFCAYAEAAADLALRTGGDRIVVTNLLEALGATEHPFERRVRLARKLATVWFFAHEEHLDLAAPLARTLREVITSPECEPSDRGDLHLLLGRALWGADQRQAAREETKEALAYLEDRPDSAARAMLNLALPVHCETPADEHLAWLARAAELASSAGSSAGQRAVARMTPIVLLLLGEETGWERFELPEVDTALPTEDRLARFKALDAVAASVFWGRYTESRAMLEQLSPLLNDAHDQRKARLVRARLDWYEGNWEAISGVTEDDPSDPRGERETMQLGCLTDLVRAVRGELKARLRHVIDHTIGTNPADPEFFDAAAALARLELAEGKPRDALAETTPPMQLIARKGVWLWATEVAPVHVDALLATGQAEGARLLTQQFGDGLGARNAPAPRAAVATCLAAIAEADNKPSAADQFDAAAVMWDALPRPYDALRARERQGRCLLGADRIDQGLETLAAAVTGFRRLGAKWDADRIARLLRQHGVTVTRSRPPGPRGYGDRLSPREGEVLALVVEGKTNREVAAALFLSPRTVAVHVSHAMRKLDVTSRSALVREAARRGLLE